jgi:hypothetical protein
VVKISADGTVQSVNVPWKTRRCRPRDGYSISFHPFRYTNTSDNPIEHSGNRFSDGGRRTLSDKVSKVILNAHMTGRIAGDRITGAQTVSVRTHDKFGRHTCTSHVRWSATRVGP